MTTSTQVRTCVQCGAPARPRVDGRGPWPKYCESCKPAPTPEKLEYNRKRNRKYYHQYTEELRASGGQCYGAQWRQKVDTVPCTGCGKQLKGTRKKEPYCRDCAILDPDRKLRDELKNGPRRKDARRKSARHKLALAAQGTSRDWVFVSGRCHSCGSQFTCFKTGTAATYCSKTCSRRESKGRRRALEKGCYITPGRRYKIYEFDKWICQICKDPIDRDAVAPAPLSPTIDHIIPLALGGPHHPANWQAAHFLCNSRKGARQASAVLWDL